MPSILKRPQHAADMLWAAYQELKAVHEKIGGLKKWLREHPDDLRGEHYTAAILWGQIYLSELTASPPEGAPAAAPLPPPSEAKPPEPLMWNVPGGRTIFLEK